jgi:hypothetical protein
VNGGRNSTSMLTNLTAGFVLNKLIAKEGNFIFTGDDIDYIILTLQEVLHKDNFRRKAIQSGERMLEEMKLINI